MAGTALACASVPRTQDPQERVRAGLAHARWNGKRLGRPITAATTAAARAGEVRVLHHAGIGKTGIARRLQIGRTSVRRMLETGKA